jgi:hypothetical protein
MGATATPGANVTLPPNSKVLVPAGSQLGTATHPLGTLAIPAGTRLVFDDAGLVNIQTMPEVSMNRTH